MIDPLASGWLSLRLNYVGPGVAKFIDPPGELRGRVRACFNERGEASLVLHATKLVTASPCESLLEFLMGTRL
jgi:hypothetical protein